MVVVAGRNVPIAAPPDLPPLAKEVWEFVVTELAKAGIIDRVDLPQLRAFCMAVATERAATQLISEPFDELEDAELERELKEMQTIANALKGRIATQIRAGIAPETRDVNAAQRYAVTLANLRAYQAAKRKAGNLVALGSMGQLVEHPLVATRRAEAGLLLRFATEFALTPNARAKLGLAMIEGKTLLRELEEDIGKQAARTKPAKRSSKRPRSAEAKAAARKRKAK